MTVSPRSGSPVVLREYLPVECDPVTGQPLDWDRCRTCDGEGWASRPLGFPRDKRTATQPCPTCDSFGSLKAAALAHFRREAVYDQPDPPVALRELERRAATVVLRCEGCNHQMSDATWEGAPCWDAAACATYLANVTKGVMEGAYRLDSLTSPAPYYRCDEGCDHGGPGREWHEVAVGDDPWAPVADVSQVALSYPREASWRQVDVRVGEVARKTMGVAFDPKNPLHVRPWDLRAANLAVLCLRCWTVSS